jgi:hypothetical protein
MGLIQFVQNYQDLSTDKGFQFRFHCDKCGNGYMTRFDPSVLGVAESVLHMAGSVFGGFMSSVSNSAYEVQRAVGGKVHDAALEAAVLEGKAYFHQCTRCGKWVCPEVCWNAPAGLCDACAPRFDQEMAAAQAHAKVDAARDQLREKAAKIDYVSEIDMAAKAVLAAPASGAGRVCGGCGASMAAGAHFCAQCGREGSPSGCPACGASIQPNTKFCAGCGAKLG